MKKIIFAITLFTLSSLSFAAENFNLEVTLNIHHKEKQSFELRKSITAEALVAQVVYFKHDDLNYQITILPKTSTENIIFIDYVVRIPTPLLYWNEFSQVNSDGKKATITLPHVVYTSGLEYSDKFHTNAFGVSNQTNFPYNKKSLIWASPEFNEIAKLSHKPEEVRYNPVSVYITATKQ